MALTKVLGHKTLLNSLQTLSITKSTVLRQVSTSFRNDLYASPVILGMPSKKRTKVDPQQAKIKADKRKKRILKALRKMDKKERMPVPLPEIDVSQTLRKELDMRQRNVSGAARLVVFVYSLAGSAPVMAQHGLICYCFEFSGGCDRRIGR